MMVTFDDAYSRQSGIEVLRALRDALSLVHAQVSPWTVDFSDHAVGLESHHTSLYNANVAAGKLQNKILDMDRNTPPVEESICDGDYTRSNEAH